MPFGIVRLAMASAIAKGLPGTRWQTRQCPGATGLQTPIWQHQSMTEGIVNWPPQFGNSGLGVRLRPRSSGGTLELNKQGCRASGSTGSQVCYGAKVMRQLDISGDKVNAELPLMPLQRVWPCMFEQRPMRREKRRGVWRLTVQVTEKASDNHMEIIQISTMP